MVFKSIESIFGEGWFAPPLFYRYPYSLRFELGCGDYAIDRFLVAHARADEVLAALFEGAKSICGVLVRHVDASVQIDRAISGTCDALRVLGFPRPASDAIRTQLKSDDADCVELQLAFPLQYDMLSRVAWAAVSADLGVMPTLAGSVYVCDSDVGCIAHPYDDRGMDAVATNRGVLQRIYDDYSDYLLPHDRAKMDAMFAETGR